MKYIAIVGKRCPEKASSALLSLPFVEDVVFLPADRQIAEPICDHPDSLICIFQKKLFVHFKYASIAEKELSFICKKCDLELVLTFDERGAEYPLDCGLNALCLVDRQILIGRRKSLAEPLKSLCTGDTRQGYAGCTALYVMGHIITADPAIEKTCRSLGVPVHKISGRDISLTGYNEGFIGGATGAVESTVCFFGEAENSQSGREIIELCKGNSLTYLNLESGPLTDRGGIKFVPIKDK